MDCIKTFMDEEYQARLRLLAQSKSERFEEMLEEYKIIFLAHLEIVKKDCDAECLYCEECAYIKNIICGIQQEEIIYFFDQLKQIYLDWIDTQLTKAIKNFENLLDKYELFQFSKEIKDYEVFFKGRISNQVLTSWDMFHIPFNKRYLINNQRYSLTGQPVLYIGNSVLDVAEELGVKNEEELKVSLVTLPEQGLHIFDLKNNINDDLLTIAYDNMIGETNHEYSKAYFFRMILASVCSFQKRQELKGFSFCEEYVLPQILANIIKARGYDGISYYSTKRYKRVTLQDASEDTSYKENIAIFTNLNLDHVYDQDLYKKLEINVPVDIGKIEELTINELVEVKNEIIQCKDQKKITQAEIIVSTFQRLYAKISIDDCKYEDTIYGKIHIYELFIVLNQILVA